MKKYIICLFIIAAFFMPTNSYSGNLDWIFSCGNESHRDYYNDIENLNSSGISTETINIELRKKLPYQPLGINLVCLYDVILRYGDNSIKEIFRKRMLINAKSKNSALAKLDPDNYSADIYFLLKTREIKFTNKDEFLKEILKLKHSVSYEYFLTLHVNELCVQSQLDVFLHLLKNVFQGHPTFGYYASTKLSGIYKTHKNAYLSFIDINKEELPELFQCVIDNTCP